MPGSPTHVGWTALMTAFARAHEAHRPDPLVRDPWAQAFLEAAASDESPIPANTPELSPMWDMLCAYFAGRTPFYDDQFQRGLADGAQQVVLLAAGLDARAVRLPRPAGVPVFEVDGPEVLDFKQAVLDRTGAPAADRIAVPADLRTDWLAQLSAAGFLPGLPTVWLFEGLLMYLEPDAADRLLATLTAVSGPGSRLATEWFTRNPEPADFPVRSDEEVAAITGVSALFAAGPSEEPAAWLTRHGWEPEVTDVAAELRRHGRPVPAQLDPPGPNAIGIWLATGTY